MTNALQVGEALSREALPLAKRGQLCAADVRPGGRLAILLSLHQSRGERRAGSLARCRRCEEDLLQYVIATILRILKVLREARLLEVHDVLATARGRADEDHATKDRRPVLGHLLGDHAAEGEAEYVAVGETQSVKKGKDVFGHFRHRPGDLASRASDSRVVEEDDLTSGGERIGHGRVPVVESPGEVLEEEQWSARAVSEPPVGVAKAVCVEELRGRGRITSGLGHDIFVQGARRNSLSAG